MRTEDHASIDKPVLHTQFHYQIIVAFSRNTRYVLETLPAYMFEDIYKVHVISRNVLSCIIIVLPLSSLEQFNHGTVLEPMLQTVLCQIVLTIKTLVAFCLIF